MQGSSLQGRKLESECNQWRRKTLLCREIVPANFHTETNVKCQMSNFKIKMTKVKSQKSKKKNINAREIVPANFHTETSIQLCTEK